MIAAARAQVATAEQPSANASEHATTNPAAAPQHNGKKRVRNFTADDRAAHRIFEKGRRDAFRARLMELAEQLPAFTNRDHQRLSKHAIVNESIARHKLLAATCRDAVDGLEALLLERDELLAEVNAWRGVSGVEARQPAAEGPGLEQVSALKQACAGSVSGSSPRSGEETQKGANGVDAAAASATVATAAVQQQTVPDDGEPDTRGGRVYGPAAVSSAEPFDETALSGALLPLLDDDTGEAVPRLTTGPEAGPGYQHHDWMIPSVEPEASMAANPPAADMDIFQLLEQARPGNQAAGSALDLLMGTPKSYPHFGEGVAENPGDVTLAADLDMEPLQHRENARWVL